MSETERRVAFARPGPVRALSAVCGAGEKSVNVTPVIQQQVDAGRQVAATNPDLKMQADPSPFHRKTLRRRLQFGPRIRWMEIWQRQQTEVRILSHLAEKRLHSPGEEIHEYSQR
jgi:hypothetical protein